MFFAMEIKRYKRLWPRYIADMYDVRTNHPNTWRKLGVGNIILSVTKNEIPFVSIGADHACENLIKLMKVRAGLVGISTNARERFFMAAPELPCLSKRVQSQFDVGAGKVTVHHGLGPITAKREHDEANMIGYLKCRK